MNIYDFWQNRFKLNTRKDYNNFDLTENTKKILCDIGLPKEPLGFIKFNIDELKTLKHEDEINSADDDTISQIIQKIKAEFEQIDELALNNQENWWPIILEQIETGMM